jgi:hypothetical protein
MRKPSSVLLPAIAIVTACALSACARFQPTAPAVSASDYTPTGMAQSLTMKDSSVHYDPAVLKVGTARTQVQAAWGDPNGTQTTDSGEIEDVYAFNPDGSKFVNPKTRARNIALGFFTAGTSIAVRQARLALQERKLTLFHILYASDDTIQSVTPEKLSGAPDALPNSQQSPANNAIE